MSSSGGGGGSSNSRTIADYQRDYNSAKARGDRAGMDAAHKGAEAVRAIQGYSGGADGSKYIPISNHRSNPSWVGNTYPGATWNSADRSIRTPGGQTLRENKDFTIGSDNRAYLNSASQGNTSGGTGLNPATGALLGGLYGLGQAGQYMLNQSGRQQKPSMEELMAQMYANMPQQNYMQPIQDMYNQMPQYTPKSSADILSEAERMADLQISPLIDAINQRINTADTTAGNERQGIEAAYANVGTQAQQLLDRASQQATESAIARGGGRSGAVEHLTEQMSTPILNQVTQSEADKAAKLSAIEQALSTYKTNATDELSGLQERRGNLTEQYRDALTAQEQALQQGNYTLATNLASQLAQLEQQAQAEMNNMMLNLLPYFATTANEQQQINLDWTDLMGQVPGTVAGQTTSPALGGDSLVSLRDAGASMGMDIGYNPTGAQTVGGNTYYGNVTINGREYTPQQLLSMGAVYDWNTQRWKIPQSAMQKLGN